MVQPRFVTGGDVPRRGEDGRVFIPTASGERQYLETAPPTSAVHGNPGFEDQTAGTPDVWDFFWQTGTASVASDTAVVYSGSRSLRVETTGASEQIVLSDTFDVLGGDRVDFAVFASKTVGSPGISLGLLTGAAGTPTFLDDDYENNENSWTALTADWGMYRRQATVRGGHTKARLFFRITPDAAEDVTAYLDLSSSSVTAGANYDTGWLALTFGTDWEPWTDTTVELPRARRQGDWVSVCGNVRRTAGAGMVICTLPLELCPPRALNRGGQVVNSVGDGSVIVAADGTVTLTSAYTTGQFVSLDLQFPVDQV